MTQEKNIQQKNEAPPTLVVRRRIRAKRERVFEAWTNPEMMKDWFYPGKGYSEVTNTLQVGGSFSNRMLIYDSNKCDNTLANPEGYLHTGKYIEISPPEKIVFTWSSHLVTDSRVTIELRDVDGETDLTLTHELLETADLRDKHNGGWDGCLENLSAYLGQS